MIDNRFTWWKLLFHIHISYISCRNFTACRVCNSERDRKFSYDIQFCSLEQLAHSIIEACKLPRLNFLCALLRSLSLLLSWAPSDVVFVGGIFIYFHCSMSMIELDPQAMCVQRTKKQKNIFAQIACELRRKKIHWHDSLMYFKKTLLRFTSSYTLDGVPSVLNLSPTSFFALDVCRTVNMCVHGPWLCQLSEWNMNVTIKSTMPLECDYMLSVIECQIPCSSTFLVECQKGYLF